MWQLQEAKQRFSEVVRRAAEADQVVTRHGRPVAVLVDIDRYRELTARRDGDFKDFLRSAPEFDPPERDRPRDVGDL